MQDMIIEILGAVPNGYEGIFCICAMLFLVWLLSVFFSIVWSFFNLFIGGGKS